MTLTEDLKEKIDKWFESKTPNEIYDILYKYGMSEDNLDKFRWHECKGNKPIEGDEPNQGEFVIVAIKMRTGNKDLLYYVDSYNIKKKKWTNNFLMSYDIIGWKYIEPINI